MNPIAADDTGDQIRNADLLGIEGYAKSFLVTVNQSTGRSHLRTEDRPVGRKKNLCASAVKFLFSLIRLSGRTQGGRAAPRMES